VHKHTTLGDVALDEIIERIEESSNIFIFAIEQRIHDVKDVVVVTDMVHIASRRHNCMQLNVPVLMFFVFRNSKSRADWTSPMKMEWCISGSV
jgi:hypothetical protein